MISKCLEEVDVSWGAELAPGLVMPRSSKDGIGARLH